MLNGPFKKLYDLLHLIRGYNGLRSFATPNRHRRDGETPASLKKGASVWRTVIKTNKP
jgi:hypothetical protein